MEVWKLSVKTFPVKSISDNEVMDIHDKGIVS